VKLVLDPHLESADIDLLNNVWPTELAETRLQLRAGGSGRGRGGAAPSGGRNPMQDAREAEKAKADASKKVDEKPEDAPKSGGGGR
jgi:hypothetical protein